MAPDTQSPDLINRFTPHPTLIIAEAGVNHNGDLELAKKLIDIADEAGADFVKFQTFKAETLVSEAAEKAVYQKLLTGASETQFQMLKKLELSTEMHFRLLDYCRGKSVKFLSSPFDSESVDLLNQLDLPLVKIPSGELTNLPLLKKIAGLGKPVFLSTGMGTLAEVEAAVRVLESFGTARSAICLLHCTTEYPAPVVETNLRALVTMQNAFNLPVGFSDHTSGLEAALGAVALGARVIEKHFTLDKNLPGPDHKASLEPQELVALVQAIRKMEQALGDGVKQPTASEMKNMHLVRKSLHTSQAVEAGELFTENNLMPMRPGTGISPMHLVEVVGKKASRKLPAGHLLTAADFA